MASYVNEPWLPENAGALFGQHWAKSDPAAGMDEIQKMRSPEAAAAAVLQMTMPWAVKEPESMSAWLAKNKNHPAFDQAALDLSRSIRTTDPAAAKAWAEQIKDLDLKSEATGNAPPDPFASE